MAGDGTRVVSSGAGGEQGCETRDVPVECNQTEVLLRQHLQVHKLSYLYRPVYFSLCGGVSPVWSLEVVNGDPSPGPVLEFPHDSVRPDRC